METTAYLCEWSIGYEHASRGLPNNKQSRAYEDGYADYLKDERKKEMKWFREVALG